MLDQPDALPTPDDNRCPNCDSRMPPGTPFCTMCGAVMPTPEELAIPAGTPTPDEQAPTTPPAPEQSPEEPPAPKAVEPVMITEPEPPVTSEPAAVAYLEISREHSIVKSVMMERQSAVVNWMTAVFVFCLAIVGFLVWQNADPVTSLALFPTLTPIPPTITLTPTWTLAPTETPPPSATPTQTPAPLPTETPRPPRSHPVAAGETYYGLSLFYNVSIESILAENGFGPNAPLQAGQVLLVPWPTATPPLTAIVVQINGEDVIADPTDCERAELQAGDSAAAVAARYGINFELLMQVNRLTEQSVLRPGDTICIPKVVYGGILPPTPGPSPTPTATSFPAGPQLLYPPDNRVFTPQDAVIVQWVAVKDLAEDEWYMVEAVDATDIGSPVHQGFTRQNSFRLPDTWRPIVAEEHRYRWRVSIVSVTGQRQDGGFIYTFGGRASQDGYFTWLGAVPTPTPTPTPLPSATPSP